MKGALVVCLAVFFPVFINAINSTDNINEPEVTETAEDIINTISTEVDEIAVGTEEVIDVSTDDDSDIEKTVIIPKVAEISSKVPDDIATEKVTVITDESKLETSTSAASTIVTQKETSEATNAQTTAEITTRKPDPCDSNPCQNGGTCTSSGKRIRCDCQKGTWGKHCEKVDWCKILQDDGTTGKSYCNSGEAKCISNSKYKNFTCACYNRKKEFDYDTGKCAAKDMCTPNPCENGGICENSGYQAHCDCPEGTSGRRCERVNWCKIKMENGISGTDFCNKGEARCLEDRKNKNFTCSCYNRKDVFSEILQKCVEKNQFLCTKFKEGYVDCLLKKASCTDDYNSEKGYTCECLDGYHFDENDSCVENRNDTEAMAFPDITLCGKDTTGFDECADRSALCYYNVNSYLGYDCICEEGMEEVNGICIMKS